MTRVCPVCSTRYAQLVDPDCLLCAGAGVLVLGRGALAIYDPPVVSLAVGLALESVSRETDSTRTLSDNRTETIRSAMAQLVAAGVLAAPPKPTRPETVRPRRRRQDGTYAAEHSPSDLARDCVQTAVLPVDAVLASAPSYRYVETDRPNARGLPVLSANGHPSHLSRILDPEEPGNNTCLTARGRNRDHLHAQTLAAAIPEAARQRTTKKRNAA